MSNQIKEVVFRKWKRSGDIIALFPHEEWIVPNKILVMSYEHIGQHGGADYSLVIKQTVPATEKEYAELKNELENIGYKLKVIKRKFNK